MPSNCQIILQIPLDMHQAKAFRDRKVQAELEVMITAQGQVRPEHLKVLCKTTRQLMTGMLVLWKHPSNMLQMQGWELEDSNIQVRHTPQTDGQVVARVLRSASSSTI